MLLSLVVSLPAPSFSTRILFHPTYPSLVRFIPKLSNGFVPTSREQKLELVESTQTLTLLRSMMEGHYRSLQVRRPLDHHLAQLQSMTEEALILEGSHLLALTGWETTPVRFMVCFRNGCATTTATP